MKYSFILIISILLQSCTTFNKKDVASPYENYKLYLEALKRQDYNSALSMLSSKIIDQDAKHEEFNDSYPFFSSVGTVVSKEVSHFQEVFRSRSCLTVNGFNDTNEPTSLNFELLNEKNTWKFSYVQMMYHDSSEEFPSSAQCPPKP